MTSSTQPLVLATLVTLLGSSAMAEVIHVPADAPTIQAGLDLAAPGDTVLVADGVWSGPGNRDLAFPSFDMVLSSSGGAAQCIVESGGTATEPHRALTLSGERSRASVVRGFTFTGGTTETGAIADQFNAGGILLTGGNPTIADCRFIDNECACWGGAICVSGADGARITGCYFEGNHSGDEGGAIFGWGNLAMSLEIDNSVFIRNSAGAAGGALASFSGATLDHVTVVENTAAFDSGGVILSSGVITNSIFHGNTAQSRPDMGIWNTTVDFCVTQLEQVGTGNMVVDPLFRADGWHLRRSVSPCVDAADPLDRPGRAAVDMDGQPRRSGLWTDIGADEAQMVDRTPF